MKQGDVFLMKLRSRDFLKYIWVDIDLVDNFYEMVGRKMLGEMN